jgi:hypothetical protein
MKIQQLCRDALANHYVEKINRQHTVTCTLQTSLSCLKQFALLSRGRS